MFFLEAEEEEEETPNTDVEPVNAEIELPPDPKVPFPVPKEPFPDPKVKGLMVAEDVDPVADMLLLPPLPVAVTVDVFGAVVVVAEILPFRLGDPGARVEVGVMSVRMMYT